MREILFRGKRIDNGEWAIGDIRFIGTRIEIGGGYVSNEVDPKTVGQFTGLKDKNGKKIFEGDIVECVSWNEFFRDEFEKPMEAMRRKMKVVFHNGSFRMKETLPCGLQPNYWDLIYDGNIEVIGNIHDNPELLHES